MRHRRASLPDRADTVIVIFGFTADRLRRQPWFTADGMASGLAALGESVVVLTDATAMAEGRPFTVHRLDRLFRRGRATMELDFTIQKLDPRRVIIITGVMALMMTRRFPWTHDTTMLMASPRLRPGEVLSPGIAFLWRERRLVLRPLLNSLVPGFLLAAGYRRSGARALLYLSRAAQSRFTRAGLPFGRHLRPQVHPFPPVPPDPGGYRPQTICYLGPPLALRGAVLALETFERAVGRGLEAGFLLLLRPDCDREVMAAYLARVERSPVRRLIDCRVGMLDDTALRNAVRQVDVLLLPFLAPVSDVPLVILEAGLGGRTVVTLDTPGVSEYANELGGIVVGSPDRLPDALIHATRSRSRPCIDPDKWRGWKSEVESLPAPRPRSIGDLAMIALCGADGCGKTCLLRHLEIHLGAEGVPTVHVWSRFRNYLSKPLLALARLTGHNRRETIGDTVTGYHDFAGRAWLALPFLVLQVIDSRLDLAMRYRRRGERMVLADRCIFDTLVDLAIDTGLDRFVIERIGPRLVRHLPRPNITILVRRDPEAVRRDRPDALADRNHERRRELYDRLAAFFGLAIIDNDGTPDQSVAEILRLAGLGGGSSSRGKVRDLRFLQQ
ncbi:MAG: hypothetical protein KDG54_04765 [Geminicoccaceae bacterium]|nr:hypothetical protein [Geminicoccaceae bacterium]